MKNIVRTFEYVFAIISLFNFLGEMLMNVLFLLSSIKVAE